MKLLIVIASFLCALEFSWGVPAAGLTNLQIHNPLEWIEAEFYDSFSGVSISGTCGSGTLVVVGTNAGDWIYFSEVDFGGGVEAVTVTFSDGNAFGYTGTIELRVDAYNGQLIGQVEVGETGDWCNFVTLSSVLSSPPVGVHGVYIVFNSITSNTVYFDKFIFNSTIFSKA